jgi:hypothetical protein
MPACLKGTIEFIATDHHSKYSYKLSPRDHQMADTLMVNFKKFGFNSTEKKTLSQERRKKILNFTNLEARDLYDQATALVRRTKRVQSKRIEIKAEGQGAFICLVAIFSGELPLNKQYFFTLKSVPLKLMRKEFLKEKSKPGSVNIDLRYSKDCWLTPLESLHECPNFLDIYGDSQFDNWVDAA